ncbi:hypothetical protein YUYDRAFT_02079 [Streptomyces sp. ScaeMP-e48]|uniref:hypothetical protein n=1 Tax=Streptomyces sp. ScaeMP-e48 TaxID=1100823 RepID=UPI000823D462|nr:hypothetical protein [Streptomyces sp. ScaeMP-e48]SCK20075.1 hypothetical protein YUYDRAFT_02079 [Streptomyces sp. ScaeMP-e48]
MQQLNRVDRQLLAPGAYQTYSIAQPSDTLVRAACEQAGCQAWARGWQSTIDESTPLGQQQAAYIRSQSGRTFREQRTTAGLTVFTFEAHQRCFTEHQTRPQLFAVRDGDWRGNPTGRTRQHQRAEDWVEDFGEHQLRLSDQQQKG